MSKFTPEQEKWLTAHSSKFTAKEIADWMQVKDYTVHHYCISNKLELKPFEKDYTPPESIYFDVDEYRKTLVTI